MKLPESPSQQENQNNTQNEVGSRSDITSELVTNIMGGYIPKGLYSYPQDDRLDINGDRTRHLGSTPFIVNRK